MKVELNYLNQLKGGFRRGFKPPSRILHSRILKFNFEKGLEGGLRRVSREA